MTNIAKFLIAALTAGAITANTVAAAHGWNHVDWTPIAIAWGGALAVFAYPNQPAPSSPTPPASPHVS